MPAHVRLFVVAVAMALLAAPAVAAAPAPRVLWLGAPPATAEAGATVRVAISTRPATTAVRLLLSRDRRPDRRDRRLGVVRPRGRRIAVALPRSTAAGRYFVLACVGGRCRASTRRVRVVRRPAATPPAPAPPAPAPPPSPGPDPYAGLPSLAGPADAVTIHPWPPASAGVSARIGPGGGRIQARAMDGSEFDLVIPPGALLSRQRVTVSNIMEIPDLPFTTRAAAAVAIVPDGLVLQRPATLRIVPAHPAPAGEQIGFAWHDDGQDLHAVPIGTDPAVVTLPLWSLSGAGVAGASAAEQEAQQQRRPHMVVDRLQQQTAAATGFERRTGTAPSREATAAWLRRAFDDAVLPALDAAAADGTRRADAGVGLAWWIRATGAQALPGAIDAGLADRFATARARFAPVVAEAYAAARAACAAEDTPEAVPDLHQLAALQRVLGLQAADADRDALACSELAVLLDEIIKQDGDTPFSARWRLGARISGGPQGDLVVGTVLVDYGWTVGPTWHGAPVAAGRADPGGLVYAGLGIDVDARVRLDANGVVRDDDGPLRLTLRLSPVRPVNHALVTWSSGTVDLGFTPWTDAWSAFRAPDEDAPDRVAVLDYQAGGGAPLVDETRTWSRPTGDGGTFADTIRMVVRVPLGR